MNLRNSMKYFVLPATLLLVGCDSTQHALNNASIVCKDGVEYFVYERWDTGGHESDVVLPHYKNTKGELYGCQSPVSN